MRRADGSGGRDTIDLVVHGSPQRGRPGEQVAFRFTVTNTSGGTESYDYRLESDEAPTSLEWWEVGGPPRLGAGQSGDGECVATIPTDDPPPPGRCIVRIVAVARETRARVLAGCALDIEDTRARAPGKTRCAAFPTVPSFRLEPDGSIAVKVSLANCGDVDLDLNLRFRHRDGWAFELDDPEVNLKIGEHLEVDRTIRIPRGRDATGRDEVETEAECDGDVLARTTSRIVAPAAPIPRRRSRALAVITSIIVLIAAGGIAAWQILGDEETPTPVVTDDPTDGAPESATPTATVAVAPEITQFDVNSGDCVVEVAWDTTAAADGTIELKRDDELIYETELGPGDYTDDGSPDGFPEGTTPHTYALYATTEAGQDVEEQTVDVVCPTPTPPPID